MNLNSLTTYIRKYGLLFIALLFFIFLIIILVNKSTPLFNFNTNLNYQKIGPESGAYTPLGYQIDSFSNATFYSKVTSGEIRYFKVLSGNTTGYFINKGSLLENYQNNPIYLGYSLSYNIFNISVPPLDQGNLNYNSFLLNHFNSIPSFLMSKKIYSYLSLNLKDFYSASPTLDSINIKNYVPKERYIVEYKYRLTPLLGQGGLEYLNKNIDIILNNTSGSWKITGVKIL